MAVKKTTYTNGEVLSPIYRIWISGKEIDFKRKQCVQSIDIKETVESSDVAVIKVADPEFLYLSDNLFLYDNPIKIQLGWSGTTYRYTFNGYISTIDIEFQDNGIPLITMSCMDNTHRMNKSKKSRTFKNTTSVAVVSKICKAYGYTCVYDKKYKFTKQETITQSDQTDIDFIQKLANDEVYPFTARLVGKKFYYLKKGTLSSPTVSLSYMKYPHDIISFSPKINKETKKSQTQKSSTNTSKKTSSTTKDTSNKSNSSKTGSTNSSGGSSSKSSSKGGYTYNPVNKTWKKK